MNHELDQSLALGNSFIENGETESSNNRREHDKKPYLVEGGQEQRSLASLELGSCSPLDATMACSVALRRGIPKKPSLTRLLKIMSNVDLVCKLSCIHYFTHDFNICFLIRRAPSRLA
ncbi:hypothetical protein O6H91_05G029700 [Diphasiastrum complanatum]|uniref:Uncharacterized protein n=1 Tax=Diphasiastrum complanatum TaxID=34168 RepID=A0ACC2DM90_DIPCM|nr:hypothetical protein O6H91_05G029700 [Diphasiastrum complanatum]